MKRAVFVLLASLFFVPTAFAQETEMVAGMPVPIASPESHSYTYSVREDGTATAWMRVDSVVIPLSGGEYSLTLPPTTTGEVTGWYRENGCPSYVDSICTWYGSNPWHKAELVREGNRVTIKVPKRRVAKQDEHIGLALGLVYGVADVTTKTWWGREVTVSSAMSDAFVSYTSIGVYLPDGVYARDKQQGPGVWNQTLSEMSMAGVAAPAYDAKMGASVLLDSAGTGQIYRYRQNLAPGEAYTFTLMSSTKMWQLFYAEILTALMWVAAIAVVLSLLMYLIVGKKPWWWYVLVMLLLMLLFVMILGLWVTYRFGLSARPGDYPASVMWKDAGTAQESVVATEPVSEEMAVQTQVGE